MTNGWRLFLLLTGPLYVFVGVVLIFCGMYFVQSGVTGKY